MRLCILALALALGSGLAYSAEAAQPSPVKQVKPRKNKSLHAPKVQKHNMVQKPVVRKAPKPAKRPTPKAVVHKAPKVKQHKA
ncbi:MAG TPA: hypothetical protein VLY04_20300 [Bryobacteraceae bacterium]|nr:hypothetical protein [Bryobacteraceae bacterium]